MRCQTRSSDALAVEKRFRSIRFPQRLSPKFALFLRIEAEPLLPLVFRHRQIRFVALHWRENQSPRPGRRWIGLGLQSAAVINRKEMFLRRLLLPEVSGGGSLLCVVCDFL